MDEETEVSDQELVARTQAGDPSAFDHLVRRFTQAQSAHKAHRGGQVLNVELLLSIFSSCPDHSA